MKAPNDPRVRRFCDLLAEGVANDLLREIQAEQIDTAPDAAHVESAGVLEPQRRAG